MGFSRPKKIHRRIQTPKPHLFSSPQFSQLPNGVQTKPKLNSTCTKAQKKNYRKKKEEPESLMHAMKQTNLNETRALARSTKRSNKHIEEPKRNEFDEQTQKA